MTDDEREAALAAAYARPLEDPVAKWKREADAIGAERAEARRAMRAQERQADADAAAFWHAVDLRIAAALAEHQRAVGDILKEGMSAAADFAEAADKKLAQLEKLLNQLRTMHADRRADDRARGPLDLPPLPLRPRSVN